MTTTTPPRPGYVTNAHRILLNVLRCKNGSDRFRATYNAMRPGVEAEIAIGLDWALEQGLVQVGTTNASARAWNRGWLLNASEMLYLTKAGKAWLREAGGTSHDFGSGLLQREQLWSVR